MGNKNVKKKERKQIEVYTHQLQNNGILATKKEMEKRRREEERMKRELEKIRLLKEKLENQSVIKDFFQNGNRVDKDSDDNFEIKYDNNGKQVEYVPGDKDGGKKGSNKENDLKNGKGTGRSKGKESDRDKGDKTDRSKGKGKKGKDKNIDKDKKPKDKDKASKGKDKGDGIAKDFLIKKKKKNDAKFADKVTFSNEELFDYNHKVSERELANLEKIKPGEQRDKFKLEIFDKKKLGKGQRASLLKLNSQTIENKPKKKQRKPAKKKWTKEQEEFFRRYMNNDKQNEWLFNTKEHEFNLSICKLIRFCNREAITPQLLYRYLN